MAGPAEPAQALHRLGRSRVYAPADIPQRLRAWHAPRPGRWERLCVTSGVLGIEWLDGALIGSVQLRGATDKWLSPGTRWRVASIGSDTRFTLEVHARAVQRFSGISPARAALLDVSRQVLLDGVSSLKLFAGGLKAGEPCIVRGRFSLDAACGAMCEHNQSEFSWHPLSMDGGGFTAFVMRTARFVDLADYLCRDHAVIESALSGLLRGREEHASWFRNLLDRHIRMEEELLFPRYIEAGGRAAWVRSLEKEHVQLRQCLASLADKAVRQALPRILDSHDEKEERIIYPDVVLSLGASGKGLARKVLLFPCAS